MRIPAPPIWFLIALAASVFAGMAMRPSHGAPVEAQQHQHGKCHCIRHGDHGRCTRWLCNHGSRAEGDDIDELL